MDSDVAKHIFKVHMHAFFSPEPYFCTFFSIRNGYMFKNYLAGWNAKEGIFALGQRWK